MAHEYNNYMLLNLAKALSKHIKCAGGTLCGLDEAADMSLEDRAKHAYNHLQYLNQAIDELFIALSSEFDIAMLQSTEEQRLAMINPAYTDETFKDTLRKLGYELNGTPEERAKALGDFSEDFLQGGFDD